jgi:hypothetical protein
MLREFVLARCEALMARRPYDFAIGVPGERYCLRWWVIPRNMWFNIYLHRFLHDDEDRACHDHPWLSLSWLLKTGYDEIQLRRTFDPEKLWYHYEQTYHRAEGSVTMRRAKTPHRVVLRRGADGRPVESISLFFTGPVVRAWGFHCPKGWVPWQQFVDARDKGAVGRGCD